MSRKLLVFAGVVSVVLVQGCSSNPTGGTPTSTASSSAAASSSSAGAAPKVQNPLPASAIGKHPCEGALTDSQLTQLLGQVPAAQHTDDATGAACQWQKESTAATIDVGYMTGVTGGLGQVYERQQGDKYSQALEIGGYPALAYNVNENPPVGACDIAVGITDSLAVDVGFGTGSDRYGKLNPCDAAKTIAQDVLDNLKAAAQ